MMRILAAVDDDGMKHHVVQIAAELAAATGAKLTVCHVMPTSDYRALKAHHKSKTEASSYSISVAEEHAQAVATKVVEQISDLGLDLGTIGLVGNPSEEVLRLSSQLKSDLVVVGFEALHGLSRVKALGSVSRVVMENAPCPVLIVPLSQEENVS